MNKRYYGYDEFKKDMLKLSKMAKEYNPDIILAIARGGLSISHILGELLENRNVFALNSIHYDDTAKLEIIKIFNIPDLGSNKKVLIVDDIIDSGDTIKEVLKILKEKYSLNDYKIASIFYKKDASITPDFTVKEAKEWIDFFWVKDFRDNT